MKQPQEKAVWYFVDEAGDPTFYDRYGNLIVGTPGCSQILILGFLETESPNPIRNALLELRNQLVIDPYLEGIPSMQKTARSFHAKDDCPEVRSAVFKQLSELDFKAQLIVARKREHTFRTTFSGNENQFYDHLVSSLFKNVLHKATVNKIYFAKKGSRKRQSPLKRAIEKGVHAFEERWDTNVSTEHEIVAQSPVGEPCLQAIDYVCWALYRAYTKREKRYYNMIADKVSFISDPYDTDKYPKNMYHKNNPFDVKKISPL